MLAYLLFNWLDTFCSMVWVPPGRMIRLIRSIDFCWPLPAVIKFSYFRQFAASLSFAFCIPRLSSLCAFAGTIAWTSCTSVRDGLILNRERSSLLRKRGVAPTRQRFSRLSVENFLQAIQNVKHLPVADATRSFHPRARGFPFLNSLWRSMQDYTARLAQPDAVWEFCWHFLILAKKWRTRIPFGTVPAPMQSKGQNLYNCK